MAKIYLYDVFVNQRWLVRLYAVRTTTVASNKSQEEGERERETENKNTKKSVTGHGIFNLVPCANIIYIRVLVCVCVFCVVSDEDPRQNRTQ